VAAVTFQDLRGGLQLSVRPRSIDLDVAEMDLLAGGEATLSSVGCRGVTAGKLAWLIDTFRKGWLDSIS